jgi:hypothetical protein
MNIFQKNIYRTQNLLNNLTITFLGSTVEQCGAGDDTKIVRSTVNLSGTVSVDTIFSIEVVYSVNGSCVTSLGSVFTQVTVLAGQSTGDSVGCFAGAPSFPSENTAVICSTTILSHNNIVDNIII